MRHTILSTAIFGVKWRCSLVGRASDQHAVDTGPIPQSGKGFFSADSLTVSVHPRVQSHAFTSVGMLKILYYCQSSVDYGNTETPSMHCRLDSATVAAGSPEGRQPEFPMGEIPLGQYSCKKKN